MSESAFLHMGNNEVYNLLRPKAELTFPHQMNIGSTTRGGSKLGRPAASATTSPDAQRARHSPALFAPDVALVHHRTQWTEDAPRALGRDPFSSTRSSLCSHCSLTFVPQSSNVIHTAILSRKRGSGRGRQCSWCVNVPQSPSAESVRLLTGLPICRSKLPTKPSWRPQEHRRIFLKSS